MAAKTSSQGIWLEGKEGGRLGKEPSSCWIGSRKERVSSAVRTCRWLRVWVGEKILVVVCNVRTVWFSSAHKANRTLSTTAACANQPFPLTLDLFFFSPTFDPKRWRAVWHVILPCPFVAHGNPSMDVLPRPSDDALDGATHLSIILPTSNRRNQLVSIRQGRCSSNCGGWWWPSFDLRGSDTHWGPRVFNQTPLFTRSGEPAVMASADGCHDQSRVPAEVEGQYAV